MRFSNSCDTKPTGHHHSTVLVGSPLRVTRRSIQAANTKKMHADVVLSESGEFSSSSSSSSSSDCIIPRPVLSLSYVQLSRFCASAVLRWWVHPGLFLGVLII